MHITFFWLWTGMYVFYLFLSFTLCCLFVLSTFILFILSIFEAMGLDLVEIPLIIFIKSFYSVWVSKTFQSNLIVHDLASLHSCDKQWFYRILNSIAPYFEICKGFREIYTPWDMSYLLKSCVTTRLVTTQQ